MKVTDYYMLTEEDLYLLDLQEKLADIPVKKLIAKGITLRDFRGLLDKGPSKRYFNTKDLEEFLERL